MFFSRICYFYGQNCLLATVSNYGASIDIDNTKVHEETLFKHRNSGAFANTFQMVDKGSSDCGEYYWSSSEHRDYSGLVWDVRFTDGDVDGVRKGTRRLSCRPCRVELAL